MFELCSLTDAKALVFRESSEISRGKLEIQHYAALVRSAKDDVSTGHKVHAEILGSEHHRNRYLGNLLIEMYGKCGNVEDARLVFDGISQRNVFSWNIMVAAYAQNGYLQEARSIFDSCPERNVVTWNAMLAAYAQHRYVSEARHLFDEMPLQDVVSWNTIVAAYAQTGQLHEAKALFDKMPNKDVVSWTTMLTAYAQAGHMVEAKHLFDTMPQRSIVSWNAMIGAYAQNGQLQEARSMFEQMPERGVVSWNAMVSAYAQNGCLLEAKSLFNKMPRKNLASWNAIIAGYTQAGHGKVALQLFRLMDMEGMQPDGITFISLLDACASITTLAVGKIIHAEINASNFYKDVVVATALVNMYGKCGNLATARSLFDKMSNRNIVSWTAMIAAYAQAGNGRDAIGLFELMELEGMQPDSIAFAGILFACSHAGLLNEGRYYFLSIRGDYGITPTRNHYVSMIGLLARAGQLGVAESLINSMPFEPDATTWSILLGACGVHSDVGRGVGVAGDVIKLNPQKEAPYVLLSNMHATATSEAD